AVISNRNPADTDAVHVKKAHDAGARLAKAAEATKTRANDLLSTHSQRISAALAERTGLRPAETLEGIMAQSELRAVVRAMPASKRNEVLRDAVKAKDAKTLAALLTAPALVTGIDPNYAGEMRTAYESAVAPELLDEMNMLIETDDALQAVMRTAETAARDTQDPAAVQAFIRAENAAQEAKAAFDSAF
ncbi:MAG: hypothetical protein U1D06_13990, partial [Paracoccaceae bacterium]|nr:hypothetical protein [Paracoccaceae bacterium]